MVSLHLPSNFVMQYLVCLLFQPILQHVHAAQFSKHFLPMLPASSDGVEMPERMNLSVGSTNPMLHVFSPWQAPNQLAEPISTRGIHGAQILEQMYPSQTGLTSLKPLNNISLMFLLESLTSLPFKSRLSGQFDSILQMLLAHHTLCCSETYTIRRSSLAICFQWMKNA